MLKNTTQPTTTDKSEKTNQSSETSKTEEKSSNLSTKNTSSKTESKDTSTKSESIWTDSPSEAYAKYLKYVHNGTKKILAYNQTMFNTLTHNESNTTSNIEVVCINEGEFKPLERFLSLPHYCARLTLRNFSEDNLQFTFSKDTMKSIIGIIAKNDNYAARVKIAKRSIVPSIFSKTPELAGSAVFHELIIDGNNYIAKKKKLDLIHFHLNPETPIRIIFENCKKSVKIDGLSTSEIETIFDNRCKDNLELINESESSKKLSPT